MLMHRRQKIALTAVLRLFSDSKHSVALVPRHSESNANDIHHRRAIRVRNERPSCHLFSRRFVSARHDGSIAVAMTSGLAIRCGREVAGPSPGLRIDTACAVCATRTVEVHDPLPRAGDGSVPIKLQQKRKHGRLEPPRAPMPGADVP